MDKEEQTHKYASYPQIYVEDSDVMKSDSWAREGSFSQDHQQVLLRRRKHRGSTSRQKAQY